MHESVLYPIIFDMSLESGRTVYANGNLVPEGEARLSIWDTALTTGEKVVEVARTFDHRLHRLDQHLSRLYAGLGMLGIDPGMKPAELAAVARDVLAVNVGTEQKEIDWQVLFYISRGPAAHFGLVEEVDLKPTVLVHCIPLHQRIGKMAHKYTDGVDLVVVNQRAIPTSVLPPQIKSTGRIDQILARREAQKIKPGATGVLLDTEGRLTEGTGTSLFLVRDGVILTSPTTRALDGVTRKLIFEIAEELHIPIDEADLVPQDGIDADEVFVTSTVICQLHGRSFNAHMIKDGQMGPITDKVQDAFIEEAGVNFVEQALFYQLLMQRIK